MKKLLLLVLVALAAQCYGQDNDAYMGIVPAPMSVKKAKGSFLLNAETSILTDAPGHKAVIFLREYLRKNGFTNSIVNLNDIDKKAAMVKNAIYLRTNYKNGSREGYDLNVTGEQVVLSGKDAGLFYGVQTLMQIMKIEKRGVATIPCAMISDEPRFAYRGMHLDVSRHFFDVDFVKKYIDLMAMYKLNTFHWHLTDDQGWRVEIKRYPKLTTVGSMRAQTKIGGFSGNDSSLFDNTPYGGFYTQEQIKEVVDYAAERFITIVPEIEMPAHSMAALAAYPIMSADPSKTYKVDETWGGGPNVYCPTDTTFHMLFGILDEVMDMFPGHYIHIGGDECPKEEWKASAFCQQLIKDSNLKDESGLQSYFIRRIERHVNARGRAIIGWDEILEGGLAPNATVMSWRGETGGIAAAQQNHDVIMTPGSGGMYFDHRQSTSADEPLSIGGNAPTSKVYAYDPVPAQLNNEQRKHIIGVQANLWTEYVATPNKAEFMVLPRLLALAEVAWTAPANKDYNSFCRGREARQLGLLEAKGYNFRVPEPFGISDTTLKGGSFTFELGSPVEGARVYYTIDGFTPRETDLWYTSPLSIEVPKGKEMYLQAITITAGGKRSNVVKVVLDNK